MYTTDRQSKCLQLTDWMMYTTDLVVRAMFTADRVNNVHNWQSSDNRQSWSFKQVQEERTGLFLNVKYED